MKVLRDLVVEGLYGLLVFALGVLVALEFGAPPIPSGPIHLEAAPASRDTIDAAPDATRPILTERDKAMLLQGMQLSDFCEARGDSCQPYLRKLWQMPPEKSLALVRPQIFAALHDIDADTSVR